MLKRLKSVSKVHISALLPLALKSIIFSCLLALSETGGIFWVLLFLLAVIYFYFRSYIELKKFFYSYIILIAYSLTAIQFISNTSFIWLASFAFGILFFLLLGTKNLLFINRQAIFYFFSGVLYFISSIIFFIADKSLGFYYLLNVILAFSALYLLMKESLDFISEEFPSKKKRLIAAGSAFLAIEIMTAVALLPIGFLNSAALVLLLLFVLEDFIFYYVKGSLNRQTILQNITILVVSIVFIMLSSKWGI